MDLRGFNPEEYKGFGEFDPLPAGEYNAAIVSTGEKPNRKGTGSYLELRFEVLEGDFKGRRLLTRLNLRNPNERAVRLAKAELAAICRATNVLSPQHSRELHDIPIRISVAVGRRQDTGNPANEIRRYQQIPAVQGNAAAGNWNSTPWDR